MRSSVDVRIALAYLFVFLLTLGSFACCRNTGKEEVELADRSSETERTAAELVDSLANFEAFLPTMVANDPATLRTIIKELPLMQELIRRGDDGVAALVRRTEAGIDSVAFSSVGDLLLCCTAYAAERVRYFPAVQVLTRAGERHREESLFCISFIVHSLEILTGQVEECPFRPYPSDEETDQALTGAREWLAKERGD